MPMKTRSDDDKDGDDNNDDNENDSNDDDDDKRRQRRRWQHDGGSAFCTASCLPKNVVRPQSPLLVRQVSNAATRTAATSGELQKKSRK